MKRKTGKEVIIVFLKRKIISLDNILPLCFELKFVFSHLNFIFVAPDAETYLLIQRNYILYEGIHGINGRLIHLNPSSFRIVNQFWNLFLLRKLIIRKITSFETSMNIGKIPALLLKFNRKFCRGRRVLVSLTNLSYKQYKTRHLLDEIRAEWREK
jgi:hypothetical protein